jgi:hypothetical protein
VEVPNDDIVKQILEVEMTPYNQLCAFDKLTKIFKAKKEKDEKEHPSKDAMDRSLFEFRCDPMH